MFSEAVERIGHKTSRNMFLGRMVEDFGLSRVEAEVLYSWNDTYLRNMNKDQRRPGQILKHIVAVGEPAGKPLRQCRLVQVRLTVDDEEDVELLRKGVSEVRMNNILRLTREAYEQGGLLSQEDLAVLLGSDRSTISGDVKSLRSLGLEVPTRGYMQDIGTGTSHKRKAVETYLEGFELSEIRRRLYDSPRGVARYLDDFARIVLLSEGGYPPQAVRMSTPLSGKNTFSDRVRGIETLQTREVKGTQGHSKGRSRMCSIEHESEDRRCHS